MIATNSGFASFSHAGLDPAGRRGLRTKLIVDATKDQIHGFLQTHGDRVGQASESLVEVLSAWRLADAAIEEAMQLPLVLRSVRARQFDPVGMAAQFAGHLHIQGREGEWRLSFGRPTPMAFGWRLIPAAQEIALSARAGRAEISLDGNGPVDLQALPQETRAFDLDGTRVPILGADTQVNFPVDDRTSFANEPAGEIAATLAEAVSVLRSYAPAYLSWVADALFGLVTISRPRDDYFQSYSIPGLTGLVFASFPAPALKIAELLVHETSHQYYHVGQLGIPFTNGIDQALYPSPYVQKERTIDRILIAFHAFANIVLFYRACLAAGLRESHEVVRAEIESHIHKLISMSAIIERSPGLSPAGRSLFEPLREELFR